tara:strand:- start:1268 stop:1738 length:471 start_codon:yes stop_codon:yes gene_type:complete
MEIIDYPNYLIYEDGRVWSKNGKGMFLKPSEDRNGYYFINLSKKGKPKPTKIHRLVGIHYIPNPENKRDVHHIDGNKLNNNISNLMWCSHQENCNAFQSVRTNNTSGHKNIWFHKQNQNWCFEKIVFGKKHSKSFKTLEEAIIYKEEYIKKYKCVG